MLMGNLNYTSDRSSVNGLVLLCSSQLWFEVQTWAETFVVLICFFHLTYRNNEWEDWVEKVFCVVAIEFKQKFQGNMVTPSRNS